MRKRMLLHSVALAMLIYALFPGNAIANTSVPLHIQKELPNARLAGQGVFRWFGLEIYTAQLWIGDRGYQTTAPAAEKFVLDLRYARNLYGARIAESSRDEIKKLGMGTSVQHQSWFAAMRNLFPDVQKGTHITGIYLPNVGARYYLDGKLHGEILDAEFAQAFFSIWLAAKTSAPELREALLLNNVANVVATQ